MSTTILTKIKFTHSIFISTFISLTATAAVVDPQTVENSVATTSPGLIEHCDDHIGNFIDAFECGDELFEIRYNAIDGGGMNVGDGGRYTRIPRADLANWANVEPQRTTGPNATACNSCHMPETVGNAGDGAGPPALNVIRDPFHTGNPAEMIQRNTPHLFGIGGQQLVAEEMTADLLAIVHATNQSVCFNENDNPEQELRTNDLVTKNVNFGQVTISPPCVKYETTGALIGTVSVQADGIDNDLVVRPFQWKGSDLSVRVFSRDAFHNELGMSPVELAGIDTDNDFDGISNEISVADVTAMAIYLAGQPRPTSLQELNQLRLDLNADGQTELAESWELPILSDEELATIDQGRTSFEDPQLGCVSCHVPTLTTKNKIYSEPSKQVSYVDVGGVFPSGISANIPTISFDVTKEMPDNTVTIAGIEIPFGNFQTNDNNEVKVELYGDLKRHDMGDRLAENIDEKGSGASVWMTKELWGLGSTAPYLHDGSATTIEEAIWEHRGEADSARLSFFNKSVEDRADILAFLKNLVLFLPENQ